MNLEKITEKEFFENIAKIYDIKIICNDSTYHFFEIKLNDDNIIGYVILKQDKDIYEIYDIFIDEKMRNMGYGTHTINYLVDYAILNNCDKLIFREHKKMNIFLERNMFERVGNNYILSGLKQISKYRKKLLKVSYTTFFFNILLSFLKLIVGLVTKIDVFILDSINSFSDSFSIILAIISFKLGFRTKNEKHPMGYGKIESIFSLIIGVITLITTLAVFKDMIFSIYSKEYLRVDYSTNLIIFSEVFLGVKIIQYLYILYNSKKIDSEIIKALLFDYRNDILLNLSIIMGLLLSVYQDKIFENLLGILISIYIIYSAISLIIEKIYILIDTQDINFILNLKLFILQRYGIKNIHDMYMIRIGDKVDIYADIRVYSNLTVEEAHNLVENISRDIKMRYKSVNKAMFHIEPMYKEINESE